MSMLQTPDYDPEAAMESSCQRAYERASKEQDFASAAERASWEAAFKAEYRKVWREDSDAAFQEGMERGHLRCQLIICHPEARQRQAVADHLALGTDLTVEEAVAVLKATPKGQSAAGCQS